MTDEMKRIADDYVGRLRRSMRGASPDVVAESEREIRAHIEDALAARGQPTVGALLDVLDRLGPPEDFGRDVALYMMVEAGYREWSLPHMIRSTLFWALSTLAGAVVVLIFGVLYAVAVVLVATAALIIVGFEGFGPGIPTPPAQTLKHPAVTMLAGLLLSVALTAVVRWFVGQYVKSARPHTLGGREAGDEWVDRTSRRILATACAGFAVTLVAGTVAGIYRFSSIRDLVLPPDYGASPMAILSGVGLLVLLLAPVLGVLWSVLAESRANGT